PGGRTFPFDRPRSSWQAHGVRCPAGVRDNGGVRDRGAARLRRAASERMGGLGGARSPPFTLVPKGGLEPPRVAPHAPQTCASASSATSAMRGRSIPLPRATDKPPDPLPQAWVERVANPLAQEVVREDRDEDRESRVHGQPPA